MTADINLTPTGSPFEFQAKGQTITGKSWGTPSACRAAVLLVHGLGAHSGWFEALARRLKVKQIYGVAYDQAGFGKRSQQALNSYEQWLDDAKLVWDYMRNQVGDRPAFLAGNSMGGVVALCAAANIAPRGLILFSPGFEGSTETFKPVYRALAMARALLNPDSEIKLPYGSEAFIADEELRRWVDNDPEARFAFPAKMLLQLLKLTQMVPQRAAEVKCPTLVCSAGRDKVIDNQAINKVFDKLAAPKKRRHFVDAYHDLMFDPAIEDVVLELTNWIAENSQHAEQEVTAG